MKKQRFSLSVHTTKTKPKSEVNFTSLLLCIKNARKPSFDTLVFNRANQRKNRCLCGLQAVCPMITHSSIRRTIPVAFIYKSPFMLLFFGTIICLFGGFMQKCKKDFSVSFFSHFSKCFLLTAYLFLLYYQCETCGSNRLRKEENYAKRNIT